MRWHLKTTLVTIVTHVALALVSACSSAAHAGVSVDKRAVASSGAGMRALIAPATTFAAHAAARGGMALQAGIRRVIVLTPDTRVNLRGGGSIPDITAYNNDLGTVPLAPEAAALRAAHAFFGHVPQAHQDDPVLPAILPFLQQRLGEFAIIPIVLGQDFDAEAMALALLPLTADASTLLIVGGVAPAAAAPGVVGLLGDAGLAGVLACDIAAVRNAAEFSGKNPVLVLLHLARLRSWRASPVPLEPASASGQGMVAVQFTGESASLSTGTAPPAAVVSTPDYQPDRPSDGERVLLLNLARRSIAAALREEPLPAVPAYSDSLMRAQACFVTITKDGQLRGSIGGLDAVQPVVLAVQQNAVKAALQDRRFPKLTIDEMPDVRIRVSVLSARRSLRFTGAADLLAQIVPGVHGVTVSQEDKRATFLPEIWGQVSDRVSFLALLCRRAGLPADAWQDPERTTIEVYEAFDFEERGPARP